MSDALFDEDDDANTPLTPQEREGLIPTYITTRAELNAAEQDNIAEADRWAFSRRRDALSVSFLTSLHRRMLSRVWRWAGQPRRSERNIGIAAHRIETELHQLVDDARYWLERGAYGPDELALRFHHRLVAIHPFPNGNGRHARLATDLLFVQIGARRFSWGGANLIDLKEARARYVAALKAADAHDIGPLLAFART